MLTEEQASKIVSTMNVPFFKQDVTRSPNIVWLVNNLGARNSAHQQYRDAMSWLLIQVETRNLMKKSEIARIRSTLQ